MRLTSDEADNMLADKSVLVTGGCGFIGATLVPALMAAGAHVRVLDNLSRGSRAYLPERGLDFMKGDIRDESILRQAARGVDAVIHLAAYGSVVESVADPARNFEINARGTLNVLQAAREQNVRRLIFASTGGALIGDARPPVDEDSVPRPISPYGAGKLCGEGYCHAFARSLGLHTVALRFANVYGPHSAHKKGAVTAFAKALLADEPMVIYGDGSASRDFLHVDDLCRGICLALAADIAPGTVLHLASGEGTRVNELAATLAAIAGKPDHPVEHRPRRQGEVGRNFARCDRARAALGFAPQHSLRDGLAATWRWFEARAETVLATKAGDS